MREATTRRINAAGRAVWFVRSADDASTVRPVTREGFVAFGLALLLVLGGGAAMMVLIVLTQHLWWIAVGFVVVGAGLATFARTVWRHLP